MRSRFIFLIILATIISIIYFVTLPFTVQIGDTGELVRTAANLEVPHPPGYPLFNWLLHFWLGLIPGVSTFWRASILTAAFSMIACIFIFLAARKYFAVGFAFALVTATSFAFWRYSVLPDVFSLNSLFISIVIYLYYRESDSAWRWSAIFFLISLSHHLTIIFLAPVAFHIFILNIKSSKRWFDYFVCIMIVAALYISLILMNPRNTNSWGEVDNLLAVLDHFLRKDYGTFKLSVGQEGHYFEIVKLLFKQFFYSFWSVFVVGFAAYIIRFFSRKNLSMIDHTIMLSMILYITVFLGLSNINPVGFWEETVTRFFIFFNVVFVFWALRQVMEAQLNKILISGLLTVLSINILSNLYRFKSTNDFSKNTIVEDNALNYLRQTDLLTNKKALLITSDTRFHAAHYIQSVEGLYRDVVILHPRLLFFPWYREKIEKYKFNLNSEKVSRENKISLEEDFLLSSLKDYSFVTNLAFYNIDRYKLTVTTTGLIMESGRGYDIKEGNFSLRSDLSALSTLPKDYDVFRDLWTDYSVFYMHKATIFRNMNRTDLASKTLANALNIFPWLFTAKQASCELNKLNNECVSEVEKIKSNWFNYLQK